MRKSRSRPIATIDAETDPFVHGRLPEAFLWDIWDGSTHYTFEHVSDVIHFLRDKEWVVYAHNGGKFDYHMTGFLAELEPWSEIMLINGRLAKFKIGACEFRDSYNILPIPLAAYKKEEIDYAWFERSVRGQHMDAIRHYLHKDTEYLFTLVSSFRERYGSGLTLAGSAMKVWQEQSHIDAPKSSRGFYNAMSGFYYGGRVDTFHVGMIDKPFRLCDINSAYPYAMLHEHPLSVASTGCKPAITDPIIPHSLYSVRGTSEGAWPVRVKNGVSFPIARKARDFQITGWELAAGIETGTACVHDIHCRIDFDETVNFTKYIHHFYDMKKASAKESPEYIFAKLFMNSLSGKFGANPEHYSNFTVCEPKFITAAMNDGYEFAGELGAWAVLKSPLEDAQMRYYNVATAASITGFVRAYLWRHICMVRKAGGEVLYCDTDSIAFTGDIPSGFRMDKELGGWSLDGEFRRGGVAGKKLYAFEKHTGGWKTGCKGVRITPHEILRICQGETVTYKRDAPSYGYGKKPSFVVRNVKMTGKAAGADSED